MMNDNETVELVVMFSDQKSFYAFLREIDRGVPMVKTLLRARLNRAGGWMRLALRGPVERVEEIVRDWRDAITSYTRLARQSA